MATRVSEVLNADAMGLPIYVGGMSRVGVNLAGTWVGTVTFYGSFDGVRFVPVSVTPFPSGTLVGSATANGNWEMDVKNFLVFKVVFTRTSGSVIVSLATSVDSSYQEAFLATTSRWVSQSVSAGATNVITVAAQANRAWRCRTCVVGFSVAPANPVLITFSDGASSTLWETYVPIGATGLVGTFTVPLPVDPMTPGVSGGGVVGTPGNSFVITLAAPAGSVVSKVNAEMIAA